MNYCLGTVQFGSNYGIQNNGRPDKEQIYEILDTAIKEGINTFDTAKAYGDAEEILGDYVQYRKKNNELKIITKCKSIVDDYESLINNVKDSCDKLKIDYLYGLMYHDANSVYDVLAMNYLLKIKNSGLAKKIGVSVYNPAEAMKAMEYKIDIIQIPYNVFDRRWENSHFFEEAKQKNIEIYARSSLLQGFLIMNPEKLPDKMQFSKCYLERFIDICDKYKKTPLEVAIGYVILNSYIDYIVFGTDNLKQFNEYLKFRDTRLSDDIINELNFSFSFVEERLLNPSMW